MTFCYNLKLAASNNSTKDESTIPRNVCLTPLFYHRLTWARCACLTASLWRHWPVCVVLICQMEQKGLVACQRHSWQPIIPSALAVVWLSQKPLISQPMPKATQVRPVFLVTHKLQAGKWLLIAYTKQAVISRCSYGTQGWYRIIACAHKVSHLYQHQPWIWVMRYAPR